MEPDDDRPLVLLLSCPELARPLKQAGFRTHSFRDAARAASRARELHPRITVLQALDLALAEVTAVVELLRREMPFTDVLLWEPRGDAAVVRDALRAGAGDAVLSPDPGLVVEAVARVVDAQQFLPRMLEIERRPKGSWEFEGMVARNRQMWDLFATAARTAETEAPVLILGETGTGKELLARAIHRKSGRPGEFVAVNCSAVPENLIDSELFGHVKGAFTGAHRASQGLFRAADRGTLMLDEIGDIPLAVQFRLLRALQEERVRPVGGEEEVPFDARVVAATSRDLERLAEEGTFRPDLMYRLDVIRLIIPPLRERPDDILFLFGHFVRRLAEQYGLTRPDLSDGFIDELQAHDWPGNVRELENFSERLLLTQSGARRTRRHFRRLMRSFEEDGGPDAGLANGGPAELPAVPLERTLPEVLDSAVVRVERAYLDACLSRHHGRIQDTADHAGISRRTLLRKMRALGLDKRDYKA